MSVRVDSRIDRIGERLTKQEIDRRIGDLAAEIAAGAVRPGGAGSDDPDDLRPRWITAAELVRRMRSFIVYN
jgi:hypothetical protein